ARARAPGVPPAAFQASAPDGVIFVDTSQDFARGHVPGARCVPRGWLELWIGDIAPSKAASVTVTDTDGQSAPLAALTLVELGYQHVAALDGGMRPWLDPRLPFEKALSGLMAPPT